MKTLMSHLTYNFISHPPEIILTLDCVRFHVFSISKDKSLLTFPKPCFPPVLIATQN